MSAGPRADAQRRRILAAAQKCFAERGFHAASMASIAETAEMSPGLIYLYFAGKAEIIQGIVRQQLALMSADLQARRGEPFDLVALLLDSHQHRCNSAGEQPGLDPGLLLEIAAEASRDPAIRKTMREFDNAVQSRIEDWLARPVAQGGLGIATDEVPARALMLRFVIDGLKMRQAYDPVLDRGVLERTLRRTMAAVVGPAGLEPATKGL